MDFGRSIETIATQGVEIAAFAVPWDSEVFGFPVAQIERFAVRPAEDAAPAMRLLRQWLDRRRIHLASCRLDSLALRESMLLEAHGFRFVEMVVSPVLDPIRVAESPGADLEIAPAVPDDLPALESIAATAFDTGRFRLDVRIDPAGSDRRYRNWVRSSLANPAHQVLKATVAGAVAGFFVVEERADGSAYWHLTAVAPAFQGKGVGRRLWSAMVQRHRDAGLGRIETTISAHNVRVMNLYAALGFRFAAPRLTLHWLRE